MANISEVSNFDPNIYQLETNDPVEGGPGGVANAQAQALANRTLWLKNKIESLIFPGQVLELDVDAEFVTANFDLTPGVTMGLGINLCEGFALCNGNNGTKDRNGRVGIGYGPNYTNLGATGGSKDAVVVAHSHGQRTSSSNGNDLPQIKISGTSNPITGVSGDTSNAGTRTQVFTDTTGVSGIDKNMQPYIVSLFIMKLP